MDAVGRGHKFARGRELLHEIATTGVRTDLAITCLGRLYAAGSSYTGGDMSPPYRE